MAVSSVSFTRCRSRCCFSAENEGRQVTSDDFLGIHSLVDSLLLCETDGLD